MNFVSITTIREERVHAEKKMEKRRDWPSLVGKGREAKLCRAGDNVTEFSRRGS